MPSTAHEDASANPNPNDAESGTHPIARRPSYRRRAGRSESRDRRGAPYRRPGGRSTRPRWPVKPPTKNPSAIVDAIDAADAQVRLVAGILREALDVCERLRVAAQCAENAKSERASAKQQVESGAS